MGKRGKESVNDKAASPAQESRPDKVCKTSANTSLGLLKPSAFQSFSACKKICLKESNKVYQSRSEGWFEKQWDRVQAALNHPDVAIFQQEFKPGKKTATLWAYNPKETVDKFENWLQSRQNRLEQAPVEGEPAKAVMAAIPEETFFDDREGRLFQHVKMHPRFQEFLVCEQDRVGMGHSPWEVSGLHLDPVADLQRFSDFLKSKGEAHMDFEIDALASELQASKPSLLETTFGWKYPAKPHLLLAMPEHDFEAALTEAKAHPLFTEFWERERVKGDCSKETMPEFGNAESGDDPLASLQEWTRFLWEKVTSHASSSSTTGPAAPEQATETIKAAAEQAEEEVKEPSAPEQAKETPEAAAEQAEEEVKAPSAPEQAKETPEAAEEQAEEEVKAPSAKRMKVTAQPETVYDSDHDSDFVAFIENKFDWKHPLTDQEIEEMQEEDFEKAIDAAKNHRFFPEYWEEVKLELGPEESNFVFGDVASGDDPLASLQHWTAWLLKKASKPSLAEPAQGNNPEEPAATQNEAETASANTAAAAEQPAAGAKVEGQTKIEQDLAAMIVMENQFDWKHPLTDQEIEEMQEEDFEKAIDAAKNHRFFPEYWEEVKLELGPEESNFVFGDVASGDDPLASLQHWTAWLLKKASNPSVAEPAQGNNPEEPAATQNEAETASANTAAAAEQPAAGAKVEGQPKIDQVCAAIVKAKFGWKYPLTRAEIFHLDIIDFTNALIEAKKHSLFQEYLASPHWRSSMPDDDSFRSVEIQFGDALSGDRPLESLTSWSAFLLEKAANQEESNADGLDRAVSLAEAQVVADIEIWQSFKSGQQSIFTKFDHFIDSERFADSNSLPALQSKPRSTRVSYLRGKFKPRMGLRPFRSTRHCLPSNPPSPTNLLSIDEYDSSREAVCLQAKVPEQLAATTQKQEANGQLASQRPDDAAVGLLDHFIQRVANNQTL